MTAETTTQIEDPQSRSSFQTLAVIFAGLTVVCALLSIVLGHRLSALQTASLHAAKQAATSEAASITDLQGALETATADLKAAQATLEEEKRSSEQLRRQVTATKKDLDKAKADLATANQTIDQLKAGQPGALPSPVPPTQAAPGQQPQASQKTQPLQSAEPSPSPSGQSTQPQPEEPSRKDRGAPLSEAVDTSSATPTAAPPGSSGAAAPADE